VVASGEALVIALVLKRRGFAIDRANAMPKIEWLFKNS